MKLVMRSRKFFSKHDDGRKQTHLSKQLHNGRLEKPVLLKNCRRSKIMIIIESLLTYKQCNVVSKLFFLKRRVWTNQIRIRRNIFLCLLKTKNKQIWKTISQLFGILVLVKTKKKVKKTWKRFQVLKLFVNWKDENNSYNSISNVPSILHLKVTNSICRTNIYMQIYLRSMK